MTTTVPAPLLGAPAQASTLDDLYPAAAWDLPVNPALPAPRLPNPPELTNTGCWREHYGPFILRALPVPGHTERLAANPPLTLSPGATGRRAKRTARRRRCARRRRSGCRGPRRR